MLNHERDTNQHDNVNLNAGSIFLDQPASRECIFRDRRGPVGLTPDAEQFYLDPDRPADEKPERYRVLVRVKRDWPMASAEHSAAYRALRSCMPSWVVAGEDHFDAAYVVEAYEPEDAGSFLSGYLTALGAELYAVAVGQVGAERPDVAHITQSGWNHVVQLRNRARQVGLADREAA